MIDEALLEAVRAAPEDDAPRLVLADRLQERGETWGELISVQCALAHERTAALVRREHEILSTRKWWPYDGADYHVSTFQRGLPSAVRAEKLGALGDIASSMPWLPPLELLEIELEDGERTFGATPLTAKGLQLIHGPRGSFDRRAAEHLVRALGEHSLEHFGLTGPFEPDALHLLLETPSFTRTLASLSLRDAVAVPEEPAARKVKLVDRIAALPLQRLSLQGTRGAAGSPERLRSLAPTLTSFRLSRPWFSASLILSLRALRELWMPSAMLANSTVASMLPRTLERIRLGDNPIGPSAIEAIAELEHVRDLDLSETLCGEVGARLIAHSFPKLERLYLSRARLTPTAGALLARSTVLPVTLDLTVTAAEVGAALPALQERFAVVRTR